MTNDLTLLDVAALPPDTFVWTAFKSTLPGEYAGRLHLHAGCLLTESPHPSRVYGLFDRPPETFQCDLCRQHTFTGWAV